MIKQTIIVLATFLFLACQHSAPDPPSSSSESERDLMTAKNFCHNPGSWEEWEDLVRKYPDDSDLQALHALRIGLCIKIDQGSIQLVDAIDIFDYAHEKVIERARQRQEEKDPTL